MKSFAFIIILTFIVATIQTVVGSVMHDIPPLTTCIEENKEIKDTLQSTPSVEKSIQQSIAAGNAQSLSSYFFSTIELTIPETQGTYSKTQAELLMKNFFVKYPVQSFTIINEGQSGGEKSKFAIGNYISTKGDTFRVYYLIKEIAGKNQLTILKFE